MTGLERAEAIARHCAEISGYRFPYEYGGGHPSYHHFQSGPTVPWQKLNPVTLAVEAAKGCDCSGLISNALASGGALYIGTSTTKSEWSLSTSDFIKYPAGPGKLITLFVRDDSEVRHVVMRITLPAQGAKWYAATFTGGPACGWQPYGSWDPTSAGYKAVHPTGL